MADDDPTTLTGSPDQSGGDEWLVTYTPGGTPRGAVRAAHAEVRDCTSGDASGWSSGFILYWDSAASPRGYYDRHGWPPRNTGGNHANCPYGRAWWHNDDKSYDTVPEDALPDF